MQAFFREFSGFQNTLFGILELFLFVLILADIVISVNERSYCINYNLCWAGNDADKEEFRTEGRVSEEADAALLGQLGRPIAAHSQGVLRPAAKVFPAVVAAQLVYR